MSEARSPELIAAYATCRAIAKREAKNFYYAFRVLPPHKSDAMCAVYAFMRRADDLADDEAMSLDARRQAMAAWTADWRASRGLPTGDPVFVALNDTQQRFNIPDALLEQLVAGTTLDLQLSPEGVRNVAVADANGLERDVQVYESQSTLEQYCYLVASVVGLVCIRIFGYSDQRAEQLAIDTGVAFQLTNILRDIKEDAERGRVYLPAAVLAEFGVSLERLLALTSGAVPQPNELTMVHSLEARAEHLYRSAGELIPMLEADSRPAMRVLMRDLSSALTTNVETGGHCVSRTRLGSKCREAEHPRERRDPVVVGAGHAMSDSATADVVIIGAGAAGIAAAVALSSSGAKVELLERKPYVGGRAYSYLHPALEEIVDSQHVMLGCCTNLVDLCRLAGADRHIRWYDRITFLEPGGGTQRARRSELGPSSLPAPAHSSLSFLRSPMLSLTDKRRIASGLAEFVRGYPSSDDEPFSVWLDRTKQSERARRHFWEPVVVSTLNDSFERCSTRYAAQVFHESLLKSPEGGRMGIPTQPLSDFYAAIAMLAEQQGTVLHLRSSVNRIERGADGVWQAMLSDGRSYRAPRLLLALPFEQASCVLATLPDDSPQRQRVQNALPHFTHAPITTIHLWLDRAITDLDHAALLDTRIQWMFNKSRIRREEPSASASGEYLELVISASFAELQQGREEILASAVEEVARFFPRMRQATVVKSAVLKEARATFSVVPGLDRFRPAPDALGDDLYLAGDWTRTGWPSTMESAVRSGRLAAEAIVRAAGGAANLLTPDLPASGLMRWLVRSSS